MIYGKFNVKIVMQNLVNKIIILWITVNIREVYCIVYECLKKGNENQLMYNDEWNITSKVDYVVTEIESLKHRYGIWENKFGLLTPRQKVPNSL